LLQVKVAILLAGKEEDNDDTERSLMKLKGSGTVMLGTRPTLAQFRPTLAQPNFLQ